MLDGLLKSKKFHLFSAYVFDVQFFTISCKANEYFLGKHDVLLFVVWNDFPAIHDHFSANKKPERDKPENLFSPSFHQLTSFFIEDGLFRNMESCKARWRKLPYEYQRCVSFSDFWREYNCLPEETHRLVGKESGQTNHIERLNNTVRQRINRYVRKTLSFSKREYMLNLHFKWFAYFYTQEIISNAN